MNNLQLNPNYRQLKKIGRDLENHEKRIETLEQGGTGGTGSRLVVTAVKLYDEETPDAPLVLSPSLQPFTKELITEPRPVNIMAVGVGFELSDVKYPTYNYIETSRFGSQTNNVLPNMVLNWNMSSNWKLYIEMRSLGGVYQLLHPVLLVKYFDINTISILDKETIPSWMG